MANKDTNNIYEQRVQEFLSVFSSEDPQIREDLANTLPSYNILLSLHAKTFEEFALLPYAKTQGFNYTDPLFSFQSVKPTCPCCYDAKKVIKIKEKENTYLCKKCNFKFTVNTNSIASGTHCSSLTWMKVLYCMLEFYSVDRSCKYCNIARNTYYRIRNKLFYAMQLMMEEVKLYGVVQCDNTFVRTSFKGYSLSETDYPEDSVFDDVDFIPREPRKHGGAYSYNTKNLNALCIYTAIDDHGHCAARYTGIGSATATKLMRAVPPEKYMLSVPSKDPFQLTFKTNSKPSERIRTLLVADKEAAIKKYAAAIGIDFEAHVYREEGKQIRLPKGAHNIQRVNALHHRLKDFLRKTHYVSSKYLPGYLIFFEFIENTGATTEAIGKLFEILVKPDLGKPPSFYEDLYVTPNYLVEWDQDNTILKNLTYNQMLAVYLYHKKRLEEAQTAHPTILMEDILEMTGYQTGSSVRRIYKNIVSSGLIETVCEKMESKLKIKTESPLLTPTRKPGAQFKPIPDAVLAIYDEYCKILTAPLEEQCSFDKLRVKMNERLNTNYFTNSLLRYFDRIENEGLRSTKLSILKEENKKRKKQIPSHKFTPKCLECLEIYNEIRNSYLLKNQTPPNNRELCKMVMEKTNLSHRTIISYVAEAKKHLKKQHNRAEHLEEL